jgi:hypothetical protein
MIAEAALFAFEVLAIFVLVGFGLVAWALPELGVELLVAPIVGLAVIASGFQWLTPIVPPWLTVVLLTIGFGAFSVWSAWQKRATLWLGLRRHGGEVALVGTAAIGFYLLLLVPVFGARFFTLASWPSDNIFLYAPAAEFLRTHAFNALHPFLVVDNPTTRYLQQAAVAFPNSVGPIDGALSMITRWEVRALFDPLNALLYALVVPASYLLLRSLGLSRRVRIAGMALLIANQLFFWVMGNAFQQEMMAMPLFIAALALTIDAVRSERSRPTILGGVVGGSLLGLYLPLLVLYVICAAGYIVLLAIRRALDRELGWLLRQLGWLVASGLATAGASLYWMLPGGGLHFWFSWLGQKIPAGGISYFYPPRYLLGVAPIADPWRLSQYHLLWWRPGWNNIGRGLSYLMLLLIVGGIIALALRRRWQELGLVAAALAYLGYLRFISQYPYGFMKTVSFLIPITSALVALGALELLPAIRELRVPSPRERTQRGLDFTTRLALAAGTACLAAILLVEAISSTEMEHLWLQVGPQAFPASFTVLSSVPGIVHGAGVLVVNPTTAYPDRIKYAVAKYYLTDNNLAEGDHIIPESQLPFRYDFMIVPWPPDTVDPGPDFKRVWSDSVVGLGLYQRASRTSALR